jgi:hypothetical protein
MPSPLKSRKNQKSRINIRLFARAAGLHGCLPGNGNNIFCDFAK